MPYEWRTAERRIGEGETDQDSLPMRRPTGHVPLADAAIGISQAEHHTALRPVEFILTKHQWPAW